MKTILIITIMLLSLFLFVSLPVYAGFGHELSEDSSMNTMVSKAEHLFRQGEFTEAGRHFEKELKILDKNKNTALYLEKTMKLAECYKALGYHRRALSVFINALPALKQSQDMYRNTVFLNALADLYFTLGEMEEMVKYLMAGVQQARLVGNPQLLSSILNDLGNAMAWYQDYENALTAYEECLTLTLSNNNNKLFLNLRIKALTNKIRVLYLGNWVQDAFSAIDITIAEFEKLPDDYHKASALLTFHSVIDELERAGTGKQKDKEKLSEKDMLILNHALNISMNLKHYKLISSCYGYLGGFYEKKQHYEQAKKMTRKAIFFARQIYVPELLYLWQWQMGRIFAAQKSIDNAIAYYIKSIETLEPVRSEFFTGYRYQKDFFNTKIKPVYLGLAELVLKQGNTSDVSVNKNNMLAAIDTMERLKTAELQDFFQDECSVSVKSQSIRTDQAPENTALIYPVSLPDKLVLLASFPDGIKKREISISQQELKELTLKFRRELQDNTNTYFLLTAVELYNCLIKPLERELKKQRINSLIIVPDGALRMIPFSALYDCKNFVIEKYAIGTIPAISLTETSKFNFSEAQILLTGLSDEVQKFPPLPSVEAELKDIKKIMNAKTLYLNQDHSLSNLTYEFKNNAYAVVHMATHGVFGKSAEKTFLLLYKNKLNMNQLTQLIEYNKYKNNRVELLTLSACQTALGDERAALGLAGVAVKAGVKSVIATLWFVDDEATSLAIREFYRQLQNPKLSKIQALQNAQKILLSQKRYSHPGYWAPFLLIGNWL